MSINMSDEQYNKIRENVASYVEKKSISRFRKEQVIDLITADVCDDARKSIRFCTSNQTEAFRKYVGLDHDGQKQTYAQVSRELNKTGIRELVRYVTKNVDQGIGSLGLSAKGIRDEAGYRKDQGTVFPEDISVESLLYSYYDHYDAQKLVDKGIYTVNDLISMSIDDADNLLMEAVNADKVRYVSSASYRIIMLVRLLGFYFADEEGYQEQQERFEMLRKMSSGSVEINNELLQNYIFKRNELLDEKDRLLSEKERLENEVKDLERKLEEAKQLVEYNRDSIMENEVKILNVESMVRTRKL